jgi:hypothetical protein
MWIQEDMLKFLQSMTSLAAAFIKSIPGEEELARFDFLNHLSLLVIEVSHFYRF